MLRLAGRIVLPFVCAVVLPEVVTAQQEQATPEEVVQKVKDAAEYLSQSGEAGLQRFQSKDSEYVWKDTYVVSTTATRRAWPRTRLDPSSLGRRLQMRRLSKV
jgi:hypothetical protein